MLWWFKKKATQVEVFNNAPPVKTRFKLVNRGITSVNSVFPWNDQWAQTVPVTSKTNKPRTE